MRGSGLMMCVLISLSAIAQGQSFLTRTNPTASSQNPGMVGYFDFGITYFQQIGSHSSYFVQVEYAIKKNKKSYVLRSLKLYDDYEFKRYESDQEFSQRKGDRYGFAIAASTQSIDKYKQQSFTGSFARHIKIGKTVSIATGLSAAAANVSLMEHSDISELNIQLDAGFMFYGKTVFGGYTLKNFVYTPLKKENTSISLKNRARHRFMLGFNHYLSHPFSATTFLAVSKSKQEEAEIEVGATIECYEVINLGAYFTRDTFIPQAGIRISKILILYTPRLETQPGESSRHEFHLNFVLD